MPGQFDFFNSARVNAIMNGVYDPRLNPQPLTWDKRIPTIPANDDEIMARFIGFPLIADILADDARASVYSMGKFQFESTKIPKIKVGLAMNEAMLKQLSRINASMATKDEVGVFNNWEARAISMVRYGVDVRREVLLLSMLFDGISYDRLGIKISNTFGMYSDLKVTSGTTWDVAGSATPVNDMLTVKLIARVRYGIDYNRATMSTTAFRYMIATTEFQNKAKLYILPQLGGSYTAYQLLNIEQQVPIAEAVTSMKIELDDRRYWSQDSTGNVASQPIHPTAGVILSDSRLDGNSSAWDFANGVVIEGIVSSMVGGGSPNVPQGPGPVAYVTSANANVDPPGIIHWGVQRGFPRKHMLAANAAITVGTFTDSISTALPF